MQSLYMLFKAGTLYQGLKYQCSKPMIIIGGLVRILEKKVAFFVDFEFLYCRSAFSRPSAVSCARAHSLSDQAIYLEVHGLSLLKDRSHDATDTATVSKIVRARRKLGRVLCSNLHYISYVQKFSSCICVVSRAESSSPESSIRRHPLISLHNSSPS